MNTVEFVRSELNKATLNLERQKKKPNVTAFEISRIEEKVKHYQAILEYILRGGAE